MSEAESSGARRFHWDNVPIPGGHTQACLYGPIHGPVDLAAALCLPTSVPFRAPSPFDVPPQRPGVCLCGLGEGEVVTKAVVPPWKASSFSGPIKTEGSALLWAD
ncbi:Hypothetical predicted protein [Scomber scombrus]|uniref:Uncharacterized protein n=1 Tax=Scomber scombrus TaxID=13677 RepID=A0AAV1MXL6_SCOSC